MFLPCPNCGFLVARVTPRRDGTEQRCPRCGQALGVDDRAASADDAPPRSATALRRRGVDTFAGPTPQPAPGATPGPDTTSNRMDRPASIATERRVPLHVEPDADRPSGTHHTDATAPVIVQAQPTPPPAAHVHTAVRGAPSFVRAPVHDHPSERQWPLYVGIAVLALALALQLVLAQRDTLAADARWRPAVEALCGMFGCTVPAWREPSAFAMLDRSVLPKPGAPGVLTARASFRNDARWPQPWPALVLTLSDVDGAPLGRRAFTPAEYAGDDTRVLMPGQSASVQLDVLEPAPGVVAFAFDFR